MSNLYRVFHKGLAGVRKLYPADDSFIDQALGIIEKNKDADYYESIYLYDQSHFEKLKETKTLSGIEGLTTDRLVFDFDSKANVQQAFDDANEVVSRLQDFDLPGSAIRIFYSGSKGFHVEVHLNERINRAAFENIVESIAGDLETFDHKIKDDQRLFRFPLTRHAKTKRYKIPLTIKQLNLKLEEIEKLSLNPVHDDFYSVLNYYTTTDLPETMEALKAPKVPEKKEKTVSTEVLSDRHD